MKVGDLVCLRGTEIDKIYTGLVIEIAPAGEGAPVNAYVLWNRVGVNNTNGYRWTYAYNLEVISET